MNGPCSSRAARWAPIVAALLVGTTALAGGPVLDAVRPERQRVYDFIELTGQGFGAYEPGE